MTTSRRDFLATVGAALGATAFRFPSFAPAIEADRLSRIGIQLYTVRSLTKDDLDGTLAKIAQIGYKEVEFAGYFNRTPAQIRALLVANKLASPSTHIGIPPTDDAWKKFVDDAKDMGHEWIVAPWLDANLRKTSDDWFRVADRFNQLATIAQKGGLKFAYHNHDFEFAKVGDATGLDVLISKTDPKLVDFEMDIYWVVKGGGDPLDFIARYPGRFPLMHVKDATAAPARAMADVGKGTIDFAKIFAQQNKSGMRHAFVEHDSPGPDPLASARNSYQYLASLDY
jgi:sugar phosphate isomerase/epimerase